jgi:hypothetical protein
MSGHGAPSIGADELVAAGKAGIRAVIVAASWHTQIMDGLIDGAMRAARDAGIQEPELIRTRCNPQGWSLDSLSEAGTSAALTYDQRDRFTGKA